MKIYKLLPLILLFVYTSAYGAYTGTMPKDIGTSTPLGSENPNIIDDVLRERGTVQVNLYRLRFVGTDTTLAANDSWVVGSSSTAMLITMPAASSCASSSVTKPFVITNYSTGTITLNISVDGVGSPTVSGSQTMSLFTDGTRWYEIRSKNAYDSDYLGGVIASGYARSGANSDITSLTGLTTALPISEGGSGQTTAAAAASALGVGTEDSPTFTGVTATTGSTTTHTSTTITATTGNVTNLNTTTGTITTLNSTTGNITNQVTTTGTITTLNSTTGNVTNLVTTTGTVTTLNSTTGNITTGNVTNLATTTGTVTTLNATTGNVTNLNTTTGTVTTLNSTTGNITNQVTTTGTITTLNNTNLTTTTGTITTLNNTNLSSNSGTFTGNIQATTASGFPHVAKWVVGGIEGTGSVTFVESTGIDLVATSSNGFGTITITGVGTSSAGGWTDTGTQTIGLTGNQVLPGGTLTIHASYGMTGVLDRDIPNTITLDNITQVTTRQLADMQGLLSLGTQTTGSATSSQLPSISGLLGSATSAQLPLISGLLGSATSAQLPTVTRLYGTTTEQVAGDFGQWYVYATPSSYSYFGTSTSLLANFNGAGSSTTFTDSSTYNHVMTANGTADLDATTKKYGSAALRSYPAGTAYASVADSDTFYTGTGDFTVGFWIRLNTAKGGAATMVLFGQRSGNNNRVMVSWDDGRSLRFAAIDTTNKGQYSTPAWNPSINVWHHLEFVRNGSNFYIFIDGVSQSLSTETAISTNDLGNVAAQYEIPGHGIGAIQGWTDYLDGWIDNFYFIKGTALHTSNFTPAEYTYDSVANYTEYNAKYIDPVNGNTLLQIKTPGTYTTQPSYIYCNATTTVFGLGTNTAVVATSTAYSGWFDGAVRATAFNVASTEKIKENIKDIKIKPDLLEAEGMAKLNYIANNKIAWIAANGENYTTVVNETGTGSVTVVDTATMESDYNNYIETEWAADLNQDFYTENIQKAYEKGFWQMFDSVAPRSWNPKDKPSLTRKGFVVEDMPDVVKGDDGQSIDPMALIAYISLVQQTLKADTIFALSTLKELIMTGTVTQQKIDYVQYRLDVLNP